MARISTRVLYNQKTIRTFLAHPVYDRRNIIFVPSLGQTGRRCHVLCRSVLLFVLFICCRACERDILKTSEPVGTSGVWGKGVKRSVLGVRRSKVKVTRGQSQIWVVQLFQFVALVVVSNNLLVTQKIVVDRPLQTLGKIGKEDSCRQAIVDSRQN